MASARRKQGRLGDTSTMFEDVLQKGKIVLGDTHPDTLLIMGHIAGVLQVLDYDDEAVKVHEEVVKKRLQVLGHEYPETLVSMDNFATTLRNIW